jgi:hypothetical protein
MQPLPPSPALTRIFASSMNIANQKTGVREQKLENVKLGTEISASSRTIEGKSKLLSSQFTQCGLESLVM